MRSNTLRLILVTAIIGLGRPFPVLAENSTGELRCAGYTAALAAADQPGKRHYAVDLEGRILHMKIEVRPDFQDRSVQAKTTLRFKPVLKPLRELRLDAIEFDVRSVTASETLQAWQATKDQVILTFAQEIPPEKETTVTIDYQVRPRQGLYFRTPEMGYRPGDTHLFSQGESEQGRNWYPCIDTPNSMFTSEVICYVPDGMNAFSNGRLVSSDLEQGTGLRRFHWSQEQPHANYLITLVAGYFKKLEDSYKGIPLAFITPPSGFAQASNSFRGTREMVEYFENEIGVPYPWEKYYQICVNDFVAGGMENTSATTLTDSTLFSEDTENINDSEGLVAHELAHQWFGDLVTCKDWANLWLNEGFATYYETLWQGHRHGRDAMLNELFHNLRMITGVDGKPTPIVRRTYGDPDEMFGYLAYQKGGWVLHMLRCELGEELYRKCVRTFLERYRHQSVVTEDLRKIIEEFSGRNYDQFFDQWVYHAHHPEIEVNYNWDELAKSARVSIRQTQKLEENVLVFRFPITFRFKGKFGTQDQTVWVSDKEEQFTFALESAPELVRVDPDLALLAKIRFSVPRTMLNRQLTDDSDMIGRVLAIEELKGRQDREAIQLLTDRVKNDGFWAVRVAASERLRSIHTDEALKALLDCQDQPDARVRRQVISDIGGFYRESAFDAAMKAIREEKNPAIVAAALRTIGGYAKPEVKEVLLEFLKKPSYRNEIGDGSLAAIRSQDDPCYIQPLLETLKARQADLDSNDLAQGLSTLGYIARNEEDRGSVREFLVEQLASHKQRVRSAAIHALGTLGDPKGIGVLEKFASASRNNAERSAADAAIPQLRAGRRPVDDFKNLRQEVLDLQKANREIKKEMEEMRKLIPPRKTTMKPEAEETAVGDKRPKPNAGRKAQKLKSAKEQ
jgi:aminopeptidase N